MKSGAALECTAAAPAATAKSYELLRSGRRGYYESRSLVYFENLTERIADFSFRDFKSDVEGTNPPITRTQTKKERTQFFISCELVDQFFLRFQQPAEMPRGLALLPCRGILEKENMYEIRKANPVHSTAVS